MAIKPILPDWKIVIFYCAFACRICWKKRQISETKRRNLVQKNEQKTTAVRIEPGTASFEVKTKRLNQTPKPGNFLSVSPFWRNSNIIFLCEMLWTLISRPVNRVRRCHFAIVMDLEFEKR
jgi:hypothetical protein